jgi:hypothetical protein
MLEMVRLEGSRGGCLAVMDLERTEDEDVVGGDDLLEGGRQSSEIVANDLIWLL